MKSVWHYVWERSVRRRARDGLLWATFGLVALLLTVGAAKLPAASSTASQPPVAPPQPALPLTSDQVAGHLGQTVDWFHHLATVEQLQIAAGDTASRDKLPQESLTAVELA